MKILADSNIWIDFFNRPDSDTGNTLETLLRNEDVYLTGLILSELLQGSTSQKEIDLILELKNRIPILDMTEDNWINAGLLSYQLRRKGIILPLSDILLATIAKSNDCLLFTRDQHFTKIPDIKLYPPIN